MATQVKSIKSRTAAKDKSYIDFTFMITIIIMLAFGLVMVLSASTARAFQEYNDSMYVFKRQLIWTALGLFAMYVMSRFDYKKLGGKMSIMIFVVSMGLLVLVLVVGRETNGATRWLGTESIGFQPSEFAKLALIIYFAYLLSRNSDRLKKFGGLFFPYLCIIGATAALLMQQPHFSCTLLISTTLIIMLFVAGAKIWHFVVLAAPVIAGLGYMIVTASYRLDRILAFLNPFAYASDEGFQIVQSLYAIGSGGIFGVGLGKSRQKFLYLPEPHNDFIFSVICEELGLIGAILVIVLFIFLIKRGIKIAANAPDAFGTFLATGIIALIGVQALVNIAVVTSSMPVTGMPLPFFSYGGSAMLFTMAAMGIMLNISRQSTTLNL